MQCLVSFPYLPDAFGREAVNFRPLKPVKPLINGLPRDYNDVRRQNAPFSPPAHPTFYGRCHAGRQIFSN
jgi:hypothetical protein